MNEEAIITNESVEDIEASKDVLEETVDATTDTKTVDIESSDESDEQITIEQMKSTIKTLREQISELERARDAQEQMLGQLGDFASLFPSVDIDSIPESVWETVKKGTSLAAAYALYEKRTEAERAKIEKINSINSLKSAGVAGKNTANEFFTPDDVRKMSHTEVHANFSKIKKSMSKWN